MHSIDPFIGRCHIWRIPLWTLHCFIVVVIVLSYNASNYQLFISVLFLHTCLLPSIVKGKICIHYQVSAQVFISFCTDWHQWTHNTWVFFSGLIRLQFQYISECIQIYILSKHLFTTMKLHVQKQVTPICLFEPRYSVLGKCLHI